jgi:hypothetical protein
VAALMAKIEVAVGIMPQDLISATLERMAWLSSMTSDRGVVLRRALLQKRWFFHQLILLVENWRFPYTNVVTL